MGRCLMLLLVVILATGGPAGAKHYSVSIPPEGAAKYKEANYTLWLPEGASRVRGIIVHQHGCGEPAELAGATATFDLQWQALAGKWDCALMGASLRASTACQDWCEPDNGSGDAFLKAIDQLAQQSGHPELTSVPWILWGHSGGANWVYRMFMRHPQRVLVLVLRSGPVFSGDIFTGSLETPVLYNLGVREKDDPQFGRIWTKARQLFEARRAKGGLDTWAPDPQSSHDCRFGRLLVIPYIDACLARRLAPPGTASVRQMDLTAACLGSVDSSGLAAMYELKSYGGDPANAVWLPNSRIASMWLEFASSGWIVDTTPPPAPTHLEASRAGLDSVTLRWQARADLESGIKTFRIYRNDRLLPAYRGAAGGVFQKPNYHDTLDKLQSEMKYTDPNAPGAGYTYRVTAVNWSDRESPKSDPATIQPGGAP